MSIINPTYFVNELLIANLSNTVDSTNSKLLGFIEKYEAKYLKKLLGETLYAEFMAGLQANPIPQKWIDLRDSLANSTTKESPIANYIYYYYMQNNASRTDEIGETQPISENSVRANPYTKMVRAWNEMVDWNIILSEYVLQGYDGYATNDNLRYCYEHGIFRYKNTLGL